MDKSPEDNSAPPPPPPPPPPQMCVAFLLPQKKIVGTHHVVQCVVCKTFCMGRVITLQGEEEESLGKK